MADTFDPRHCPACGATFGCGARTGGCWCAEVTLDAAVTARARELGGEACLCPSCLGALAPDTVSPWPAPPPPSTR